MSGNREVEIKYWNLVSCYVSHTSFSNSDIKSPEFPEYMLKPKIVVRYFAPICDCDWK